MLNVCALVREGRGVRQAKELANGDSVGRRCPQAQAGQRGDKAARARAWME